VVQEQAYFISNSTTTGAGSLAGATTTVNITPLVVPVGLVLDIQPQIGDDGSITLAVNPSVSSVVGIATDEIDAAGTTTPLASANLPIVNRRDLDTVVRIQSGETLVLAGIIQTSDSVTNSGVPWLKNIPFLGALFKQDTKSKSRTELAVFITPTLLEDGEEIASNRLAAEKRLKEAGADPVPPGPVKHSITEP
jgi:general secretion pathway protein D